MLKFPEFAGRLLVLAGLFVAMQPSASLAQPGPRTYTVTQITINGDSVTPWRINDAGQIVCTGRNLAGAVRGFVRDPDGTVYELAPLTGGTFSTALRIDANGNAGGSANDAYFSSHCAVWLRSGSSYTLDANSTLQDSLQTLLPVSGKIVGTRSISGISHAVLATPGSSGYVDLTTTFGLSEEQPRLMDMNEAGQAIITGVTGIGSKTIYRYGGSSFDLPMVGTSTWVLPYYVNPLGVITGIANSGPSGTVHAFIWWPYAYNGSTGRNYDIGTLGGASSIPYSIGPYGEVVGESDPTSGAPLGFLYVGGVLYNVNNLIPSPGGVIIRRVYGINSHGGMVAIGAASGGGAGGFLLTRQ